MTAVPGLLGRERELARLGALLERARLGEAAFAVLEGEAGIGKTALLEATAAEARQDGFAARFGTGEELARDRPFGAVADALELSAHREGGARGELAALLYGQPADSGPHVASRITSLIVDVVEELGDRSPLLLVLDDLQWADASTLAVVDALVRRLRDARLALVLARRPHPSAATLESLLDRLQRAGGEVLALPPLDDATVDELAERVLGRPPEPPLRVRLRAAGGSPLYVQELAAALRDAPAADDGLLPPSLRATVLRRLSALAHAEQELLRLASVLGSSFSVRDLAIVAERDAVDVARALTVPQRAGFVRDAGERLAFRHDVVREALYYDMPETVRATLHLQAARALIAAGRPPAEVAAHVALGAAPGDTWAVEWLRRAAVHAAARAPAAACDLLDRALAIAGDDDRLALLMAQLEPLAWAGRPEEAVARGEEALALRPDREQEARIRLVLIGTYTVLERPEDGAPHAAAAEAIDGLPAVLEAELLTAIAVLRFSRLDLTASRDAAARALALASRSGDRSALAAAQGVLSLVLGVDERVADALELARQAAARAEDDAALRHNGVEPLLATALARADRLADARRVCETGAARAARSGARWLLPSFAAALANIALVSGDWEALSQHHDDALQLAAETGEYFGAAPPPSAVAVLAAVHRGELAAARAALDLAERTEAPLFPVTSLRLGAARAAVAEAEGRPGDALALLAERWRFFEGAGVRAHHRALAPDLARLACACGDRALAVQAADAMAATAAIAGTHSARAAADYCRATLAGDARLFRAAAASYDRGGWAPAAAMSVEAAGAAAAEGGDRDAAVADLGDALERFAALGAAWDVRRVEAALRALGVRRASRAPRRTGPAGWEALTESERRVASLVADGLSNREVAERLFLSPRTVEAHLRAIFRKLGVRSRAQLAAASPRDGR